MLILKLTVEDCAIGGKSKLKITYQVKLEARASFIYVFLNANYDTIWSKRVRKGKLGNTFCNDY